MRILIIVPAYNEAGAIQHTIQKIKKISTDFDILVIDDCSKDQTASLAKAAGAEVVSLPINLGIGGAVQTGFKYAEAGQYDIAIQVDGDGQHDPGFIPHLIRPIVDKSADVVIGSRFIQKKGFQSHFMRRMGIRLFQFLNNLLIRQNITDSTSGFRAYNLRAIRILMKNYPTDYPEPEAVIILKKKKCRIAEIPVEMLDRQAGASSISGFKSAYYMIKVTLSILIEFMRVSNG